MLIFMELYKSFMELHKYHLILEFYNFLFCLTPKLNKTKTPL